MDQKLVNLYELGKFTNLTKLVNSLIDTQKISDMLTRRVIGTVGDPIILLRALLKGCDKYEDGMKARHLIFIDSIKLLQDSTINVRVATDIIAFLLVETDKLSSSRLAELTDFYIEAVKSKEPASGRAFELLPKILASLTTRDNVLHGNNNMSGSKFKDHVLNSLCSSRWEPHCILPLTSIFREIPMMSDQLAFVIKKVIRGFPIMNLQEVAPLIYQLLVLTTRGHKDLVIKGILNFFNNVEKQDKTEESEDIFSVSTAANETIQHTEGTVIVHVTFAVRHDQHLGKELGRILKDRQQGDPSAVLQSFTTALVLAVSRIHAFNDQMINILKTSIFRCYKNIEKHNESKFIEEIAPQIPDIASGILSIVKNSSMGWDHVTHGLIELGFSLMESYGPKAAFGGRVAVHEPTAILTPTQKACQLGISILQEIFKLQEAARQDVIEQVLNHLVTSSVHPVHHYLKLLSGIMQASPHTALDFQAKVRETFDYLTQLPLETANGLLVAVQPLIKVSMSLKDALMLMLRKALFSRQVEGRKLAATGYLLILKNFKVYGNLPSSQCSQIACSSSQVFVDVHQKNAPDYEAIVCTEILGSLRRTFNQQADVRLILYEGLYEALSNNSNLKGQILEMLSNQFQQYHVEDEEVLPPVKLESCITAQGDNVYITEPLTHLLMALSHSLLFCKRIRKQGTEDDEEEENVNVANLVDKLDAVMMTLAKRMINSEMEDFELDKSADYSLENGVGVRNNIFAILVLGIYEVLMEYVINNGDYSSARCEQLLQMFTNYLTLSNVLKEKAEGKKAKDTPKSLLSVKFATETMRALFSLNSPSHDEGLTNLRQNADFVQHMLTVTQQKIHQIDTGGQCDGPEGTSKDRIFIYCSTLARVLLQQLVTPTIENQRKDKSKPIVQVCLETLSSIIHIICTRYPSKIREFLDLVDVECDKVDDDEQVQIHAYIKKFQRLLISYLTSEEDDVHLKDAVHVCTIISRLSNLLNAERPQFKELYAWLLRVCAENNPDDSILSKALIALLLSLTTRIKSGVKLTRDISQDIHAHLGDIDEDVEVDSANFALINPRTAAPSVLLLVVSHIDQALEEADWILGQMMSQLSSVDVTDPDTQTLFTSYEDKENMICVRLGLLINSYHELVQSVIPVGQSIDVLMKSLIHMYTTLRQICKYYLNVYEKENGHFCERFPKLIKLSGTHLTQQVYAWITYVQAAQSEQLQPEDTKAADKAKRKKQNKDVKVDAKTKNAQKVLRGSRPIPNLIYSIEQYERILIKLGKRAKMNLMEHVKSSTSRDFRINFAVVEASLEDASGDEQTSEDEDKSEEEDEPPKKKKMKLSRGGKK